MPSTSGTYEFQSVQVDTLILEAFERIGISGEFIEPTKLSSAKRSINLLLLSWMGQSTNLWTMRGTYIPLVTGQRQYSLPTYVSNIVQANLRTSQRPLNGTPQSNTGNSYDNAGSGDPVNDPVKAFDDNPDTFCTQGAINGNISYDYGENNSQTVTFLGIRSHVTIRYDLSLESCLLDPTDIPSWKDVYNVPAQVFTGGVTIWFDIPTPVSGRAFRIREKGGAILNMEEIYFNTQTRDYVLSPVSRYEYNSFVDKYQKSRPTVYYLDRQLTPVLNIWPTPAPQYNCMFYSYKTMIQDVGLYTDTVEIPARFYPALIWGLGWYLSLKYNPEVSQMMKSEYDLAFSAATVEDSEEATFSIQGDYSRWAG